MYNITGGDVWLVCIGAISAVALLILICSNALRGSLRQDDGLARELQSTRKALKLALRTIHDLQGHKVTGRDVQELLDNVQKIQRGE
jgi:hypothetical protein